MVPKVLMLFCLCLITIGCSRQILDKSLKIESYTINDSKVTNKRELEPNVSGIYKGIDDMCKDSDYVVTGVVRNIEYFEAKPVLLRKINVLVSENYKGTIEKNTLVSVIENDGYLRLKTVYADLKKEYEHNFGVGDKKKEEAFLYNATFKTFKTDIKDVENGIKDIENDMLIKYYYINKDDKDDSKIGDKLLLFMTDSSDNTYKDKKVNLGNNKLAYPKGAYAPLGIGMGKFTQVGDSYNRYNYYYTPDGTILKGSFGGYEIIKGNYTVKEMKDELKKLK